MRDANPGMFVAYLFALVYFFGGVGAAADMFMGAIEAMTAVTRTVKRDDGSHVEILVWNKTVSNLSLMALGSSAPEIMLAVVGVRHLSPFPRIIFALFCLFLERTMELP